MIFGTLLNGFNYCHLTQTVLFNIKTLVTQIPKIQQRLHVIAMEVNKRKENEYGEKLKKILSKHDEFIRCLNIDFPF